MTSVLHLEQVSRTYGVGEVAVPALRNVHLTMNRGDFVAVMGPSGSGKSTLLGIAGGLDTVTAGQVVIDGTPLAGLSRDRLAELRRRKVGFVFQDFNLVPSLTAAENVALPLELDGVQPRAARTQALAALTRVGLPELADRFVDQMSGGQRQRVAIARAIIGERRLVLADEPTGALDSNTGEAIMELLRDLADDGIAVMLVTHEARFAGWADRVIFLRDGRIVDESRAADDPAVLLAAPQVR